MEKRRQFIIASGVFTVLLFLSQIILLSWRYFFVLGFTLFAAGYLFLLFLKVSKNKLNIFMVILSILTFIIGVSLFSFLISGGIFWRLFLLIVFAVGMYTLLLTENVFLVAAEFKTVPLYRAASTVGFLMTLVKAFFLFNILFSLRLPFYMNGLATFLLCFILLIHFLWSNVHDIPVGTVNYFSISILFSLILAEFSTVISFWPTGVEIGTLYLVSLFYVFGGLLLSYCHQKLFKKTVAEFVWVGLGTFLALFLVTSWRGKF